MQTLKAYLRESKTGPGVSVSLPMPPEGKPIPQVLRFLGSLYDLSKILSDGGLLYLRRRHVGPDGFDEPAAFTIDRGATEVRELPKHVRYGQ